MRRVAAKLDRIAVPDGHNPAACVRAIERARAANLFATVCIMHESYDSDTRTPFSANIQPLSAKTQGLRLRDNDGAGYTSTVRSTAETQGSRSKKGRTILAIVVPPVDEFDLVGPLKVFGAANRLASKPVYDVRVVTNKVDLSVQGEEGLLAFAAQGRLKDVSGRFDSVLLVCGLKTRTERDPFLFRWMKSAAPEVRRFGAVCVGSFLLAEAGLLNGKRATTHWKFSLEMAKRYPKVRVESEPIWVKDGNIYTSAGISAGIDLALAWVEEDCGAAIAQEIASELVLFLRRSGHEKQLSVSLSAQASRMKSIQELHVWILENLHRKLTVPMLADRVAMSVRTFERVFAREVGERPSRYILKRRVEAARLLLEQTDRGLKQIASACGFANEGMMRRAFLRSLGTSPHRYRLELSQQKTAASK